MAGFIVAPGRTPYPCYRRKEHKEAILQWLASGGPNEWHIAADFWNWGGGHDVPGIICEQPECDRATAQMVFLRTEPAYYLGDKGTFARGQNPGSRFKLALDILARWRRGLYTRSQIGLSEDDRTRWPRMVEEYRTYAVERWNSAPELMLPEDFLEPAAGMPIDKMAYWSAIPNELKS